MSGADASFWDQRYCAGGAIWGEQPSPTAVRVAAEIAPGARVLDIGFGYGRDLVFFAGRSCRISGVECAREGHRMAEQRLRKQGHTPEQLYLGRFEELALPETCFDAIFSHRMAHLLLTAEAVAAFRSRLHRLLRPGGILALGVRNCDDLDPALMIPLAEGVYENRFRPGHRIRYWDDASFRELSGSLFTIDVLERAVEAETQANPIPCHLTILIARKKATRTAELLSHS